MSTSILPFRPDQLAAYHGTDFELIPLHSPETVDKNGRKLGKAPLQSKWRLMPALTVDDARAHMIDGAANVGVRLRPEHLVIDVDPRRFENDVDSWKRLRAALVASFDDSPTVETGGGGLHIYMRKPADLSIVTTLEAFPGVEFKTAGTQAVAAGSVHPDSRRTYVWDVLSPRLCDVGDAPSSLLELITRQAPPYQPDEGGKRTPDELATLLAPLDPANFSDHDRWFEIMAASHHATSGQGRQEFIDWSTGDPSYLDHGDTIGRRWDSLSAGGNAKRLTEKTLFKILHDAGHRNVVNRMTVKDDFSDIEESESPRSDPVEAQVARMNERFCAVLEGGQFTIFMEDIDDTYHPPRAIWTRLSREAFRHYHANELMVVPDQRGRKSVADIWLNHPKMRKYRGIVMDPDQNHGDRMNLWRGWGVVPKSGDWSLLRDLIDDVLCAGDSAASEYVRRWIAFMLQKPGVRPETAIAFRGGEGTGKGTLGRALMRVAGTHGLTVSSANQFAGRFNAHLRNAVFLFADEAFWPGHKDAEGTLKQLVTEPVISYEAKGRDIVPGRNLVHIMMASNENWIVPAGADARRFAVFDVSDSRRGDREFFGALDRQLSAGGLAAMVHDLITLDLGNWHPAQEVPQTQALADQKLMSLEPASKFWMEVLEHGYVSGAIERANWEARSETLTDGRQIIIDEYDAYLKRNRIFSAKATSKALTAAGVSFGLETTKIDRGAQRAWVLPPLHVARERFQERFGAKSLFD